jgi:hypothetical protein
LLGVYGSIAYRKEVVGVFVRFHSKTAQTAPDAEYL